MNEDADADSGSERRGGGERDRDRERRDPRANGPREFLRDDPKSSSQPGMALTARQRNANSTRRVGSGRVLARDAPAGYDKDEELVTRRGAGAGRTIELARFGKKAEERGFEDRRRLGDRDRDREPARRRNDDPRTDRRGGGGRREERQPEWMMEDVDQNGELMELGGFDDELDQQPPAAMPFRPKREPGTGADTKSWRAEPRANEQEAQQREEAKAEVKSEPAEEEPLVNDDNGLPDGFNYEDFLHPEALEQLSLATKEAPVPEPSAAAGSRFSQFFNRPRAEEAPQQEAAPSPPASSLLPNAMTEEELLRSAEKGGVGGRPPRPNSDFYFSPISPEAVTDRARNVSDDKNEAGKCSTDVICLKREKSPGSTEVHVQ